MNEIILYKGPLPKLTGYFKLIRSVSGQYLCYHKTDYKFDRWQPIDLDSRFTGLSNYIYIESYKAALDNLYKLSKLKSFV
jgi:hypothetical protein